MHVSRGRTSTVAAAVMFLFVGVAMAQEPPAGPPPGMPPVPQPGPEHAILKADVGTWDAAIELFMGPGAPPAASHGTETNRMGCGGLCLIGDFQGDMMGMPFEGHGVTIYDGAQKKYVGIWVDSMSAGMSSSESTYDAATKTMTGTMTGSDMSGAVSTMKVVGKSVDADTRVFEMHSGDAMTMKITYKRKKM